jgi:ABC-type branched-subunit amino acid transport system ATPase component
MTAILELRNVNAAYGSTQILQAVELAVEEGGITTLLGANGAGKTTILRAICNMMVRASGRRQQAGTLSGGEQQMLAISRALMLRPKLLLLDEPSFGLAPLMVQEIFRILRAINRNEGVGMLLVEQNVHLALELADHAYLIETGCIVMGGPAAIIACNDAVCRAYLGY